jgi:peptidyl-prolyl cis-trans isomerase C
MSKKSIFLIFLFLVFLNVPVFAGDDGNDAFLAKIGDRTITMEDFKRFTASYDSEKRKLMENNPQYKATILLRFVQGMVIAKMAREDGFDKRPDIKAQIEVLVNDFLATEYVKAQVIEKMKVTDEDMNLYYKVHKDEFTTPEMMRVRDILVAVAKPVSEEAKEAAKTKAEGILKRIRAGEDFAKLATEFSDDGSSKTKGGDLGFLPRSKMPKDFEKTAFSLKAGEVSDVVETPSGYYIIKAEGRQEAREEPFDKVREKVKAKVFADLKVAKIENFINGAMEKAGVEMNFNAFRPKK